MKHNLKTIDLALQGCFWLVVGVILDFSIQIFATAGSQGLAMSLNLPKNGLFATVTMVSIVLIFMAITVSVLLYAIRRVSPKVGWHPIKKAKAMWMLYGYALIILGSICVNSMRMFITGHAAEANNQMLLESVARKGSFGLLFIILLAVVVAPVVEELIFRGIVLNYFFKEGWWWLNILLSAVLFGYFHVYSAFNIFDFIQYSVMGLSLALVYKKTRQIQYAMGLHFINNSISIVFLVVSLLLR